MKWLRILDLAHLAAVIRANLDVMNDVLIITKS